MSPAVGGSVSGTQGGLCARGLGLVWEREGGTWVPPAGPLRFLSFPLLKDLPSPPSSACCVCPHP